MPCFTACLFLSALWQYRFSAVADACRRGLLRRVQLIGIGILGEHSVTLGEVRSRPAYIVSEASRGENRHHEDEKIGDLPIVLLRRKRDHAPCHRHPEGVEAAEWTANYRLHRKIFALGVWMVYLPWLPWRSGRSHWPSGTRSRTFRTAVKEAGILQRIQRCVPSYPTGSSLPIATLSSISTSISWATLSQNNRQATLVTAPIQSPFGGPRDEVGMASVHRKACSGLFHRLFHDGTPPLESLPLSWLPGPTAWALLNCFKACRQTATGCLFPHGAEHYLQHGLQRLRAERELGMLFSHCARTKTVAGSKSITAADPQKVLVTEVAGS